MRSSFLRLLDGESPDRTVWTADIGYWLRGRRPLGLRKRITSLRMPRGALMQEETFLPQSACWARTKHFVETESDLGVLQDLLERRRLLPADYDFHRKTTDLLARYDGIPIIAAPRSPLPGFFYDWAGVPGAMFSHPFTWDDMRKHVQRVLDLWEGTPFILSTADQVPPDGDVTFCRKIADLLEERAAR